MEIQKPIVVWKELINNKYSKSYIGKRLKKMNKENLPYLCEFTVNNYCPNSCKHCIYPKDFHINNKNISYEKWKIILKNVYEKLKLKIFVINGRSLNDDIFRIIKFLKNAYNDIQVGLIIDGTISKEYIDKVVQLPVDWIDVSVDGLEKEHDIQRNEFGLFQKTLFLLFELKKSPIEKINILTTITTINYKSILDMIVFFNQKGFLNFFITPVSVYNNKPNPKLKISKLEFQEFLEELLFKYKKLKNSYVKFHIFDIDYLVYLKDCFKKIYSNLNENYESLEYEEHSGDNDLLISIYPGSLTYTREYIINCDGRVVLPLVMANSVIDDKYVFSNLENIDFNHLSLRKNIEKEAFDFYVDLLIKEKSQLNS